MDLRAYYRKVRDLEAGITAPYVVVASLETPDGGKAGVFSQVHRYVAARQIAEMRSRLATSDESETFHRNNADVKKAADDEAALNRMQVMVVPARGGSNGPREKA